MSVFFNDLVKTFRKMEAVGGGSSCNQYFQKISEILNFWKIYNPSVNDQLVVSSCQMVRSRNLIGSGL